MLAIQVSSRPVPVDNYAVTWQCGVRTTKTKDARTVADLGCCRECGSCLSHVDACSLALGGI